jgi:hypothetical protein
MKKKVFNAKELMDYLLELQDYGLDLSTISLHYREHDDSDVELITGVCEDLFDEETNSILESILFYTSIEN